MHPHLRLFIVVALLVFGPLARAELELYAEESIPVYTAPSRASPMLSQIRRGERWPISVKKVKGFRKVKVRVRGESKMGYVFIGDLERSRVITRGADLNADRRRSGAAPGSLGFVFGLTLSYSYLQQGARTVGTSASVEYEISSLSSTAPYFNFFARYSFSERLALRGYLALRSTAFEGDSRVQGVQGGTGKVSLEQNFWGLGGVLSFHRPGRSLWWGAVGEASKGRDVSLKIGGVKVNTSDSDLPLFLLTAGAVGWDFVFDRVYLIPELRAGMIINTDPFIWVAEAQVSLGYEF